MVRDKVKTTGRSAYSTGVFAYCDGDPSARFPVYRGALV